MSAILDKLLKGQKVEWKTLGDVSVLYGGLTGKNKADFENGNAKYVSYKNIFANLAVDLQNLGTVKANDNEKQHFIKHGDILFTGSSETQAEAGISSVVTEHPIEKIYLNSFSFGLRFNDDVELMPEFTKFLFRGDLMRTQIARTASGVTRFNISKERFKKIQVPIPPLDVQAEIVRILDAFTAVTAELTAELNMREKQYQYYRDKLLTFSDNEIIWKSLGEVVKMQAGKNIKASQIHPSQTDENLYPCFGGNGIRGYVNNLSHQGEYVIIGRQGALCGNVQRVKGNFYATEHAVVVTVSDLIDVDWAYHMLSFMNLNQYASKSAQPGLAVGKLEQLEIPVPSLSEQKRVAKILDKLDTITHSITQGLPKEITLRKQQYEYYREQLLDFPRN